MLKLLFLDVDGVLNNQKHVAEVCRRTGQMSTRQMSFAPENVEALNHILDRVPDAMIVVSSVQRKHYKTLGGLRRRFAQEGVDRARVLDRTPVLGRQRGEEILAWLKANLEQTVSYVILDDDSDMAPLSLRRLVKTSWEKGLTFQDAERAIRILRTASA